MKRLAPALLLLGCAEERELCTETAAEIRCAHETTRFDIDGVVRDVHWQVPAGEPPPDGWPVALLFQGTSFPALLYFRAPKITPFGGVHQAELTRSLLDGGYAVLAPEALGEGLTCWQTNVPPWSSSWSSSSDAALLDMLDNAIASQTFGNLDPSRQYAAGISSGGYMSSRLAVSLPGRFAAIAIVAGSWMTCAGLLCEIPDEMPPEHPPTLFLHGALDPVVPLATMTPYAERLAEAGIPVEQEIAPYALHAWAQGQAEHITSWFQ